MRGGETTVERWEWEGGEGGKGEACGKEGKEEVEMWKRSVRVGDGFLPCAVTFKPDVLAVGGVVKFHDFEWVVEECWEWK
jgi:hypothetical protein